MAALLAYLFYFVAASASPIQRRHLAKRNDGNVASQVRFSAAVMLFPAIIGSFVIPFFAPAYWQGNLWTLILLTIGAGISGAASFGIYYVTQRHVEAGIGTLVSNVYTPVTIAIATLFLGEKLTPMQLVGTMLLLVGVIIVSKKHRIGRFKFDKYFLWTVASGVLIGIVLALERALQKTTGFTTGTLLSWWAQALFLLATGWVMGGRNTYSNKDLAITGTLRFFQAISYVTIIFFVGNLSVVASITTFKVVIVFLAAALFLKEREDLGRKLLGSLIAVAGLLLMGG